MKKEPRTVIPEARKPRGHHFISDLASENEALEGRRWRKNRPGRTPLEDRCAPSTSLWLQHLASSVRARPHLDRGATPLKWKPVFLYCFFITVKFTTTKNFRSEKHWWKPTPTTLYSPDRAAPSTQLGAKNCDPRSDEAQKPSLY